MKFAIEFLELDLATSKVLDMARNQNEKESTQMPKYRSLRKTLKRDAEIDKLVDIVDYLTSRLENQERVLDDRLAN